jgi:hypothetical protein
VGRLDIISLIEFGIFLVPGRCTHDDATDDESLLSAQSVVDRGHSESTEEGTTLKDGDDVGLQVGDLGFAPMEVVILGKGRESDDSSSQTSVVSESENTEVSGDGEVVSPSVLLASSEFGLS